MSEGFTAARALVGCLYAAVPPGTPYGFALYSPALKTAFDLSQQQLDNINTVPSMFGVAGPLCGAVAQQLGPRLAFLFGGLLTGSMQALMYLVATKRVPVDSPPLMLVVLNVVAYFGLLTITAAAFTTPVQHFQRHRGDVVALVKTFTGLGAAVISQLYVLGFGEAGDGPAALNCLLMWALVTFSCSTLAAALTPTAPHKSRHEPYELLSRLFYVILLLACFTTVVSFVHKGPAHDVLVPVMLALALLPLPITLVPCRKTKADADAAVNGAGASQANGNPERGKPELVAMLLKDEPRSDGAAAETEVPNATPVTHAVSFESPESHNLWRMLGTLDAWLLLWVGMAVIGGGSMIVTNLAQVLQAARARSDLLPTTVTLYASGNMLGRLLSMRSSDRIVNRGRPRPLILVVLALTMASAHLGFLISAALPWAGSLGQTVLLCVSTLLGGLAFGSMYPHLVVLASELFGSKNLTVNYIFFDGGSNAVGTMILANVLPSWLYAMEAGESNECLGVRCFAGAHLVVAVWCSSAVVAAVLIARRAARLYLMIAASRAAEAGGRAL